MTRPPHPHHRRQEGASGEPRLLDAFCGAGGATRGYQLAGWHVTGVDIRPQPRYVGEEFRQGDALEFIREHGHEFDAIHASPPCQSETPLRHLSDAVHPDLLTPTLALLGEARTPWVVENVAGTTKLPGALVLCGTEFGLSAGGRWLRRHRRFGSNVFLPGGGGCMCGDKPVAGVYGDGGGGVQSNGSFKFRAAEARRAMGIDWMTRAELSQAIPPAYTEHIGHYLHAALERSAA